MLEEDSPFYSIEKLVNDSVSVRCKECGEVEKGNLKSTGNLISHHKLRHDNRSNQIVLFLKGAKSEEVHQPSIKEHLNPASKEEVSLISI